jgi:hypothetical protein
MTEMYLDCLPFLQIKEAAVLSVFMFVFACAYTRKFKLT